MILPVYISCLIASHRILRFLMRWLFVALQAMTPFIHAGAVRIDHGGFLRLNQRRRFPDTAPTPSHPFRTVGARLKLDSHQLWPLDVDTDSAHAHP
jgi:hypothetical protein